MADALTHKPRVPGEEAQRRVETLEAEDANGNEEVETRISVDIPGTDLLSLKEDPYFKTILKIVQGDQAPSSALEQQRAARFRLEGDALWLVDASELGRQLLRRCVAGQQNQDALIKNYHNPRTGGHQGAERTLAALTENFFFPRMSRRVRHFVGSCDSCQRVKADNSRTAPIHPVDIPASPGEVVSLDFLEVPQSLRGNNYILTMVDKFSKLVKVVPTTKEVTAEKAAELVLSCTLPTFARLPGAIISDRDSRFTAELWQHLWSTLGVTLRMTTAHRPQADGQSERANRQILEYLRHYVNAAGSDWDSPTALAQLEFALNSSMSSATRVSPYEALMGRAPVAPAALGQPVNKATEPIQAKCRAGGTRQSAGGGGPYAGQGWQEGAGGIIFSGGRSGPTLNTQLQAAPGVGCGQAGKTVRGTVLG